MGRDTPRNDVDPDPYGSINLVGAFFSCGLAGGSAVHFIKGLRGSPSGARLAGAVNAVRLNAPRVAGVFGAYSVFLVAVETTLALARGVDDTWGAAAATGATWGLYGMRRGDAPAAARCTLLGTTCHLGLEYAVRLWDLPKEMDNGGKPVPVLRSPEAGRRPSRWEKGDV